MHASILYTYCTYRSKTHSEASSKLVSEQQSHLHCVDGLQPYLEYKRLLLLVLLAKSYCENPFLPNDIFSNDPMTGTVLSTLPIKANLCRVDALTSHLEGAVLISGGESKRLESSFERAREQIVARRLQAAYRNHRRKSSSSSASKSAA